MSEALVEMTMPATVEAVDLVHDALDDLWTHDETVSPRDRFRVATAVVEIVGNVVEHAYVLDAATDAPDERRLDVRLRLDDAAIEAVLTDNGRPAPIDLSDVRMPDDEAESGRGLALAMASLDEVAYERIDGRNQWTLRCRRSAS